MWGRLAHFDHVGYRISTMTDYEITYVSNGEAPEETRAQLDAAVDDELARLEASVEYAAPHLPRRLFYPIKKKRAAGLRLLQLALDPEKIQDLKNFLKKQTDVLRFSILQTARRPEASPALLDQFRPQRGHGSAAPAQRPSPKVPAKPLSEADVEKSIEKALTEQVK